VFAIHTAQSSVRLLGVDVNREPPRAARTMSPARREQLSSAMQIPILRCEFPVCDADRLVPPESRPRYRRFCPRTRRFRRCSPSPIGRISFSWRRHSASQQLQSLADRMAPIHHRAMSSILSVDDRAAFCPADKRNRLLHTGPYGASSRSSRLMTAHWHAGIHTCPLEERRSGILFLRANGSFRKSDNFSFFQVVLH
jgi:hypothetical protein